MYSVEVKGIINSDLEILGKINSNCVLKKIFFLIPGAEPGSFRV